MYAHVAGICLFWVGTLAIASADDRPEAAMRQSDILAYAIGYAAAYVVAVPVLVFRQMRTEQTRR